MKNGYFIKHRLAKAFILGFLIQSILGIGTAAGQWQDSFDDGNLTEDPFWIGSHDSWQFLPQNDGLALFTKGVSKSDTLMLATVSDVAHGSWTFDFGYRNGLLSNFNLARIYLISDQPKLTSAHAGYYLQIGTNERDIRLYRIQNGRRTLVRQFPAEELLIEAQALQIEVRRLKNLHWEIFLDGRRLGETIDEQESTIQTGYFGLWVKHTQSRSEDFWFDSIVVEADTTQPSTGPSFRAPAAGEVIINEVFYAPPRNDLEFVELQNLAADTLALCDLRLADSQDNPVAICADQRGFPPSHYAVVARDSTVLRSFFPHVEALSPSSWPALNNAGDEVRLYADSRLIEVVAYASSWGKSSLSLERRDPAGPSQSAFNWGASEAPEGATPGLLNSIYMPDQSPPRLLFVEALSPTRLLTVWTEPIEPPSADAFRAGGATAALAEYIEATQVEVFFDHPISAHVLEAAGVTDLTGNVQRLSTLAIAYPPKAGAIRINEIMYEPRADPTDLLPDQPEYVEIVNPSDSVYSLRLLTLDGTPRDDGKRDMFQSDATYPVLSPGGYAVFYAGHIQSSLEAAFPSLLTAEKAYVPLSVPASTLRLSNSGGEIELNWAGIRQIDAALYNPGQHHPDLAETRGVALERRALYADTYAMGNWGSSTAAEGGTPGQPNSILQSVPGQREFVTLSISPNPFTPDGDGLDDVVEIRVLLQEAPQRIEIRIFDARGRLIRTLTEGTLAGTETYYFWDGRAENGLIVPVGLYILLLDTLDLKAGKRRRIKQPFVRAWAR